jgi:hypothetical protein
MDLFITQASAETQIAVADVQAEIETPVGVLQLDCVVDGEDVAAYVPTRARTVGTNATLTSWRTQTVRADLLLVNLLRGRPSGPSVTGTVAAMWRLAAWRDLLTLQFDCRWAATPAGSSVGPLSSAGLEAHGWETETTKVVIGTEGRGSLIARAASADGFPARLTSLFAPRTVRPVPTGLRLLLPPLARHEQCQIQFVVAWADKPDDDATFLAVQRDPAELLDAAHVL